MKISWNNIIPANCPQARRVFITAGLVVAVGAGYAQGTLTSVLVRFAFENVLKQGNNPDTASITFFSGSVGPYKAPDSTLPAAIPQGTIPGKGTIRLANSGFGAPFSADVPYGNFVNDTIFQAQTLLYPQIAQTNEDKDKAAFRYKIRLYGPDTGQSDSLLVERTAAGRLLRKAEEMAKQERRDAAIESLEALADEEVPTLDQMYASLPESVELTDHLKHAVEREHRTLQRRVDYAKKQLHEMELEETRKHQGRAIGDSVRCNFEDISDYYGDPERERIEQALTILMRALKYAPLNKRLSGAYLDVFYDKAVAELQFIKIAKVDRARYRLGLEILPPDKQFVIDQEIEILRDRILPNYESVLTGLSELLQQRGGINVSKLDPSIDSSTPLGFYVFKRDQPSRNKMAAQWLDGGILTSVPQVDNSGTTASGTARPIFNGYKDYVMILTILSDYLYDAADLARMYGMRQRHTNDEDDFTSAIALISHVQQETALDVRLLEAMFSDYHPTPGDASGVLGARHGILSGLGEMEGVRNFLAGTANALGFDPDFLVLVKEFPDTTSGNQFDSFDALFGWIIRNDTSVYNFANTTYQTALARFDEYRGSADQVFQQLDDIETELAEDYNSIVGTSDIDDVDITISNPAPGSELAEALANIEALKVKRVQLAALTAEIIDNITSATVYLNEVIPRKGSQILAVLTKYKNTVSKEFDTITAWSATAAGAQAAFDTTANTAAAATSGSPGAAAASIITAAAGAVNTAIQTAAAAMEGEANKNIDAAQATFSADIELSDLESQQYEAAGELGALRRELIGNAIEVQGLQSEYAQAQARYVSLLREVSRIKARAGDNISALADRYYADPIHQLRSQSSQLEADSAFRDAQKWVFFVQRALEYKWNKPFVMRWGGKNYDSGSIIKMRNFDELDNLVSAMQGFNLTHLANFNREPFTDRLSLKYDFWGLNDNASYAITQSDGTSATVSASELFQIRLADLVKPGGNTLEVPLDTFSLRKTDGVFFTGPDYSNDGSIVSAGKYLDKIEWMKFNVVTSEVPRLITGAYSYGGTSYIRTQVPSCLDTGDDRSVPGEFRQFPFRYFLLNGAVWSERPTQDDTVKIVLSNSSSEPPDSESDPVYRNTFLKERSVAATQQKLTILTSRLDISRVQDIEIYVRHQFVSRELPVCN